MQKSEDQFIDKLASAMAPVIVPVPMGGGGGASKSVGNPGTQTLPPDVSAYSSSVAALDLSYRLSMGAVFS